MKRNLRQKKHESLVKKPRTKLPAREVSKEEADAAFGTVIGGFLGAFAGALAGSGVRTMLQPSIAANEIADAIEGLIEVKASLPVMGQSFEQVMVNMNHARTKLREAIERHVVLRKVPLL